MTVPFICLQCGYREERSYTVGRMCPECDRARLVAYTEPLDRKKEGVRKYVRIKPEVVRLKSPI